MEYDITDFLEEVSSELYLAFYDDKIYLMSSYHLGDEEFDYGIYDNCEIGKTHELEIPDIFVDEHFNFLKSDMISEYGVSKKDADIISELNYGDWYDKAKELGYDNFADSISRWNSYLNNPSDFLKEFTKDELETKFKASNEDIENIKKFEGQFLDTIDIKSDKKDTKIKTDVIKE